MKETTITVNIEDLYQLGDELAETYEICDELHDVMIKATQLGLFEKRSITEDDLWHGDAREDVYDIGDDYFVCTKKAMVNRIKEKNKKVKIMTHKQKHYKECVERDDLKKSGLSPRTANVLRAHDIFTVEEIMEDPGDIMNWERHFLKFVGMGRKGLAELEALPAVKKWFDDERCQMKCLSNQVERDAEYSHHPIVDKDS